MIETEFVDPVTYLQNERDRHSNLWDKYYKLLREHNSTKEKLTSAIIDWSNDLLYTRDQYIDAISSGRFNNRKINPELAKKFAHDFAERADAVRGCTVIIEEVFKNESNTTSR